MFRSSSMVVLLLTFAVSASSQQGGSDVATTFDPNRAFFLSAEDVAARAAEFDPGVAYSNTTVLERADPASPTGLAYRFAVDRRTPPQRAAAHTNEAELWAIVGGSGEITTGGRIVEVTRDGEVVERRIEGGTVHRVSAGDFLVIPEGVPHEVTGFDPSLLMVTFEFPRG